MYTSPQSIRVFSNRGSKPSFSKSLTSRRVVKGSNYVYHCAASLDFEKYNVGVGGRKKLVEEAVDSQTDILRVRHCSGPLACECVMPKV